MDALNQLATASDRSLAWWPLTWPENIRVVFSTLPGDVCRELQRRGWMTGDWCLSVPPLQPGEKKLIMELYLQRFARNLEPRLQERLMAAEQTANPLFLRTVLDELRLRSRHEDLDRNLDAMLQCGTPEELFVKEIGRAHV